MLRHRIYIVIVLIFTFTLGHSVRAQNPEPNHAIVLHAARLLDVATGKILKPGEILVQGDRILEVLGTRHFVRRFSGRRKPSQAVETAVTSRGSMHPEAAGKGNRPRQARWRDCYSY